MPSSAMRTYAQRDRNHLLDLLPPADQEWLLPQLECRSLEITEIMVRRDRQISFVFFPTSCIASVITQMDTGETVETGTIGNDGFVGVPVLLDALSTPNEVICQVDGDALTMRVADFRAALERSTTFRSILNRFTQAYLVQMSQTTACNRLHQVSERCAKWLLMTHDRVGEDTFPMTQEFLALMLGVRRASVSVAAAALQDIGVIAYHRGSVTVLDRKGLEVAACECYALTREEYDRLLSV